MTRLRKVEVEDRGSGPQDQNFDEGRVIAGKNRPELSRRLLDLARESIVIRTGEMALTVR